MRSSGWASHPSSPAGADEPHEVAPPAPPRSHLNFLEPMFEESAILGSMVSTLRGPLLALVEREGPGRLDGSVHRAVLAHGAWVDVRPGWLGGAGALFDRLLNIVPWRP